MWLYVRVDPAISVKRSADETAIVVDGVDWRGYRWSVDGWVGREKRPTEIVRKTFAFARKWQSWGYKVFNIGFESVAYQEALNQLARDGVPEREATFHGESVKVLKAPCAVRSIKRSPNMRKDERILEMDGPISRCEHFIWKQNPIGEKMASELKNFPFDTKNVLDALHDMWESGVIVPPRLRLDSEESLHPDLRRLLRKRRKGEGPQLVDTHNKVKLAGWG
jgi:hypothetical protein